MKKIIVIVMMMCLTGLSDARSAEDIDSDTDDHGGKFTYHIGPGDVMQINVWRHPDLSMQVRVRPDGRIAFPIIEEINAANVTTEALKQELSVKLGRVIRDPQVTINMVEFESQKIFVLGEVNRPGAYPFDGQERVLEALSKAMGYRDDTAALKSVLVIKNSRNHYRAMRVNMFNFLHKGDIKQNILLEPGDIVFVPKTFIADLNKFIDQFFTKTDPVLKYYLDIYNIRKPGVLNGN